MSKQFSETSDGVHLVSPLSDYTLCGDALEGDEANGLEEVRATRKRTVTCLRCAQVVLECRGVHVAPEVAEAVRGL